MSYFSNILRSLGQKLRQEEEAIQTLSNRLQHATLASDRKLAVLGLKSFSRQYREIVVQYGLRGLLVTLGKDVENAPLVKAVLETLLNLFLRTGENVDLDGQTLGWISNQSRVQNGKYPSPLLVEQVEIDEFSNWIADEMILTDAHVQSLMLVLLQHTGFQIRLYALQLLEAVVATRPVRAKECILNIPLAVSTVVSLLDDPNDPIRNETILLLMALVNNNYNIQKLVAFENTFEKIFAIIEEEGGIRGLILVQDCMTLLTNLLTYNASNQTFFLETDCVPKLANLIAEPIEAAAINDNSDGPILAPPIVWTEQRLQNMAILLEICRSFVDPENQHLVQNQQKLYSSGIFFSILRLVFAPVMENPIRKTALQATGDIISNNPELQLQFAHIDVPYIDPSMPLQTQKYSEPIPAPLALLNWAILTNSVHIFEVRLSAMYCLSKFFLGNPDAKMAFLIDQVKASKNPNYYTEAKQAEIAENEGENEGEGEGEKKPEEHLQTNEIPEGSHKTPYANIFTTLTVFNFDVKLNPYSVWFSAIILVYIISDCPDTRQLAREMKVGNAEEGEEEMSSIQAISGMLIAHLENEDPRIAVGYFILLSLWLYEDFDAVNDFLSDTTVIKTIVAFLSKNSTESSEIIQGMGSVLVGICYDFTTKSSPFPRENLYELITKSLGPDTYALKIKQFKNNSLFRQFDGDLQSDFERDSSGLPNLFFIPDYVELIKDNYYRIRKSLSRGPHFEPRSRISFEIFEEMENKNVELKKALEDLNLKAEDNEKTLKLQVEEIEAKLKETSELLAKCNLEVEEARTSEEELIGKIEVLSTNITTLEAEKKKFESSSTHYMSEFHKLSKKSAHDEESLKQVKDKLKDTEAAKQKAEDGINKMNRELFLLTKEKKQTDATISNLEKEISKLNSQHEKTIKEYQKQVDALRKTNEELRAKLKIVEQQGFNPRSSGDEQNSQRLRDLQNKVSEMEEANDNLMEKLRYAAGVVLDLRTDKSELEKEKESLESELARAYEDLEEMTHLLEEVEELKEKSTTATSEDGLESFKAELEAILQEKAQLEERLMESTKTIESLQSNLIGGKRSFDQEISSVDASSLQETREIDLLTPATEKSITDAPKSLEDKEENVLHESNGISSEFQQNELSARIEGLNKELSLARSNLERSQHSLELETNRYTEEINLLKKEHLDLLAEYEKLQEEHQATTADENPEKSSTAEDEGRYLDEIKKKDSELEFSQKRIKDLERNIEVLSESAGSSLESFKNSQNALKSRIEGLEDGKKKLLEEVEELKQERVKMVDEFQEAYDDLENAYMDLELLQTNLEKHKEDLEKQLKKLEEDSSTKIEKLTTESESLKKALSETRAQRDDLRREYYELEKLTNIIGSELQAKEALLQAISNKGADLAAKDKIVIEIKERLASTIVELGDSAQKLRVLNAEKSDLNKLYEESVASFEKSKQRISELELQITNKSEELEKSLGENKKLAAAHKNFFDANKANEEYLTKIEALENEILSLKNSLGEVSLLLDDQRKLNCESSLAAALEFTEKSTKLEKSILENQDLHDKELEKIRESSQKEIQGLNETIASLKEENKKISEQLIEAEKLGLESETKANDIISFRSRTEVIEKELEQLKAELARCKEMLSDTESELKAREVKISNITEAHEESFQKVNTDVSEMKEELAKLKTTVTEKEEEIRVLVSEQKSLLNEIEDIQIEKKADSASAEKLAETQALYSESEAKLSEKSLELEKLAELLEQAKGSIKLLEEKIQNLEQSELNDDLVQDLKSQIEKLEEKLVVATKETDVTHLKSLEAAKDQDGEIHEVKEIKESIVKDEAESQRLNDELEELKSKAKADGEKYTETVSELEKIIKQKTEELEKAEIEIKIQHEELTASISEMKQAYKSLEDSTLAKEFTWKAQLQQSEEQSLVKEKEIEELKEKIGKIEEGLAAPSDDKSEPEVDTAQEDFVELMLICDSQEQKIKKYKRKLRALDIPVSSDESDEEDLL